MQTAVERSGIYFALVGPAGSGKTTFASKLLTEFNSHLRPSVSYTTRAMRPGEQDAREYHFVSHEEFSDLESKQFFFETEKVHGNYYGTPREPIESVSRGEYDLVLDIDIRGAVNFRQNFPENAVIVFLVPPSLDDLIARVQNRGGSSEGDLQKRLLTALREYEDFCEQLEDRSSGNPHADYFVVNDEIEAAYAHVRQIYLAETQRAMRFRIDGLKQFLAIGAIRDRLGVKDE